MLQGHITQSSNIANKIGQKLETEKKRKLQKRIENWSLGQGSTFITLLIRCRPFQDCAGIWGELN